MSQSDGVKDTTLRVKSNGGLCCCFQSLAKCDLVLLTLGVGKSRPWQGPSKILAEFSTIVQVMAIGIQPSFLLY